MDSIETVEDILSNFLESLGEAPVADDDQIQYGSLTLTFARKVSDLVISQSICTISIDWVNIQEGKVRTIQPLG
jgi:hypothetical protein